MEHGPTTTANLLSFLYRISENSCLALKTVSDEIDAQTDELQEEETKESEEEAKK